MLDLGDHTVIAVSIHAPREGCDNMLLLYAIVTARFNSRTPGGVRQEQIEAINHRGGFQFTHPGRGATKKTNGRRGLDLSFNSRTPGGVRHVGNLDPNKLLPVSIHAPREGCDDIQTQRIRG